MFLITQEWRATIGRDERLITSRLVGTTLLNVNFPGPKPTRRLGAQDSLLHRPEVVAGPVSLQTVKIS
jgi:hypothetical protein